MVGQEGLAYVYHPPIDSDEEQDDVIHDRWGLTTLSDDEADLSDGVSDLDDDSGSLRESPVPDDGKCE